MVLKSTLVIVLVVAIAIFCAPQLVNMAYAWELDVHLTQSTFGTSTAEVTIVGPYGWRDQVYVETGEPSIIASIDVPDDEIPEGNYYQVCVGAGLITLSPNCQNFTHGSGDESVSMTIPS